eukprot:GHVU01178856.1.p1 GENE.GHVU01178856.1~~GHVU01178856.1.p1  ORF type:complete len:173 (-),score=9.10 GHVU01178856.1:235-753(-)
MKAPLRVLRAGREKNAASFPRLNPNEGAASCPPKRNPCVGRDWREYRRVLAFSLHRQPQLRCTSAAELFHVLPIKKTKSLALPAGRPVRSATPSPPLDFFVAFSSIRSRSYTKNGGLTVVCAVFALAGLNVPVGTASPPPRSKKDAAFFAFLRAQPNNRFFLRFNGLPRPIN